MKNILKKCLALSVALVLVLIAFPLNNVMAQTGTHNVNFLKQWTNESSVLKDTLNVPLNLGDKLGNPREPNTGLLRGAAKIFLAWSTKPIKANGTAPDDALLFSAEDTLQTAIDNGLTANANGSYDLYGIYFELQPGTALSGNPFAMGLAFLGLGSTVNKLVNSSKNSIEFNKVISAEDTLPSTTLYKNETTASAITVIDNFDLNALNDIVVEANFEMEKVVSYVMYKNPYVSNSILPIFNREYATKIAAETAEEFKGFPVANPNYTYVDLAVDFDPELIMGEYMFLEFDSYAWRPMMVLDAAGQPMEIVDPTNNFSVLGKGYLAFNKFVSNTNSKTVFVVKNPAKSAKFTIRTTLRYDDKAANGRKERIAENLVRPTAGVKTVGEEIVKNMTLKSLTKKDIKALYPNFSDEQIENYVFKADNLKLSELVEQGITEKTYKIDGSIFGKATADLGSIGGFSTASTTDIKKVAPKKPLNVGWHLDLYKAIHKFISITPGKELPPEVLALLPEPRENMLNGMNHIPFAPAEVTVKVADGTWTFVGYDKAEDVVNGADIVFTGSWKFAADAVETDAPAPTEAPSVAPVKTAPKTGDTSNTALYVVAILLPMLLAAYVIGKKKQNQ